MPSIRWVNAAVQPCRPGIKVASTLVELPQYQDVMDHRLLTTVWHLQIWRAQHTGVNKRVYLARHTEQLEQENLIPPRMHACPGCKRNTPYKPSQSMPRTCPAGGITAKPNVVQLSQGKGQKTIEAALSQRLTLLTIVDSHRDYLPPLFKETSKISQEREAEFLKIPMSTGVLGNDWEEKSNIQFNDFVGLVFQIRRDPRFSFASINISGCEDQ